MATTQYIGARYVPRHMGEWNINTQYGALDVVLYTDGNSYTAKCFPPKGTPPTNDQYWALSAQFNQQLAALDDQVKKIPNKGYYFASMNEIPNTLENGDFGCCSGYSEKNDGGEFDFFVTDTAFYTGTESALSIKKGDKYVNILFDSVLNAKWFGCKGNGETDDTIAMQSAITMATVWGVTLYVPVGTYKISATLNANNRCSIIGGTENVQLFNGGNTSTIFTSAISGNSPLFNIGNNAAFTDAGSSTSEVTMKNIRFNAVDGSKNRVCLYISGYRCIFENIHISGYGIGIFNKHGYYNKFRNIDINTCYISFLSYSGGPQNSFENCWFAYGSDNPGTFDEPMIASLLPYENNETTAMMLYRSKISADNFSAEGCNVGFVCKEECGASFGYVNMERIKTKFFNVQSGTNVACNVKVKMLNTWNDSSNNGNFKVDYGSKLEIGSIFEKIPANLVDIGTGGLFINTTIHGYAIVDVNIENMTGTIVNNSHFSEEGLIIDVTVTDANVTSGSVATRIVPEIGDSAYSPKHAYTIACIDNNNQSKLLQYNTVKAIVELDGNYIYGQYKRIEVKAVLKNPSQK